MSYILFFKIKGMENKRMTLSKEFDTFDDAMLERHFLIEHGYKNEEVIHTAIKEGRR